MRYSLIGLSLLFAVSASTVQAEEAVDPGKEERTAPDDKSILTLNFENDLFSGQDGNYTNGVRAAWSSSEENAPQWVRSAGNYLLPSEYNQHKRVSIAVGQNMYTPSDTQTRAIIPDDRPYAGWLYGSIGIIGDTGQVLDTAMLTVGVVGPASHAEEAQRFVHKLRGIEKPQGWDNQLDNEPGVILTYERKWRNLLEVSPFGLGMDVTPQAGVNLGNVYTDAGVGAMLRIGYDLPADYGPPRIRPSLPGSDFFIPTQDIGWYLFAGFEGRAVARNIFLDGNSFQSSHSVDKENFVGNAQLGIAFTYGDARLTYTHVFMTKEFETQDEAAQFGALSLSYRF